MKSCIIKKGKHKSSFSRFTPHINCKTLVYQVSFTSSCKYNIGKDQDDINKLFGLSFGFHHKNSARIGWRWNNKTNRIELLAYVYRKGKRVNEWDENIIISNNIELNEEIILELLVTRESYLFSVDTYSGIKSIELKHEKLCKLGYELYPYFGGNQTAPHNIEILLEKIY